MAYSDPRTWVTGELVTAALMNAQLRDNLDAVIEGTTGAYVNAVTGPHVVGGSTVDYVRLGLTGAFTSGGASTVAFGTYTSGVLTGHSGDSGAIAGIKANNSVVTAGNCTTIAQLWVSEPQITVGSGTVTNSATVYIEGAASEATNDYALWVDAGATQLDGALTVGGAITGAIDGIVGGTTPAAGTFTQVDITGEGDLRLQDNTGGQYVGFDAPSAVSTSYTLTFPAAIGSVDQALTINNVDGTLQWATPSSFNPDGAVTFNDSGADVDFRVESSGNANMLLVDGGEDRVGIGQAAPDGTLHVETGSAGSISWQAAADDLIVEHSNHGGITVATPADKEGSLVFLGPTTTDLGIIAYAQATPGLQLHVANAKIATVTAHGLAFGADTADANALDDYEEGTWTGVAVNVGGTSLQVLLEGYTKIGNLVSVWGALDANSLTTTGGSSYISGLPFTPSGMYGAGSAIKGDWTQAGSIVANAGTDRIYITTFSSISGSIQFLASYTV